MKENNFDSKFRFVIVASQRAKQLLKGSPTKIKSKYKSPIRIAQEEIKSGAVQYDILPFQKEDIEDKEGLLTEAIPLSEADTEVDFVTQETEEFEEESEEEEPEENEELEEEGEGNFDREEEDK
ncbi:MAG: DNA-directed RNA polymerase subunit omega [Acidobacteriota bacterium]|nr:DNA-directed RNA polymerase subunit omega [Acidobacteriota bacterium]MDW3229097.1 DNA-directed RNA polymerase subunit omega [Acidobacteriota bacterium]MDY0232188.1 DNA-directed RNA polymerase subunit omega [Candidatus Saccharicenans sp.]